MASLTDRKFSFTSTALAPDTFTVVSFEGNEGLSVPYRFEVLLAAQDRQIDLGRVINHPVRLTIHRENADDVFFNGILSDLEQLQAVDAWAFYRAVLVPRLWWLSLTHHNQVFLDQNVPEILEAVLNDGGLTALDYALRLRADYAKRDYVCQYGETHLDFLARWMAREGIYYYFEQSESAEKLIITDTAIAHGPDRRGSRLHYAPATGLDQAHRQEIVRSLDCQTTLLPARIKLKDVNYRKPSLEVTGAAEVDPNGRGEVYIYGEHLRTPEEANRLAAIRAEALIGRGRQFFGDSTVPYIQPGYTFSLMDHYRDSFNTGYLTVKMSHEGNQTGYLTAGLRQVLADREQRVAYSNRFTAIPASVQFRPAAKTMAPRITGTLNAWIDASGSGRYAELDDQGRYKIRLPFDLSGRKPGKASARVRMAQPYAGSNHGMHLPLRKGTEVLLAFVDGNPDRPVILAALPNPDAPSPVTVANQTQAVLRTASGNRMALEDQPGSERILLHVPAAQSFFRMGQPNDPEWTPKDEDGKSGWTMKTPGWLSVFAGTSNTMVIGESTALVIIMDTKSVAGIRTDTTIGDRFNISLGTQVDCVAGLRWKCGSSWTEMHGFHRKAATAAQQEALARNQAIAQKDQTIAALTKTIANKSKMIASRQKVIGENTAIVGSKSRAIGKQDEIIALKDEIIGTNTRVIAEKQRAILTKSDQIAEKSHLIGELTTVQAMEESLAASNNRIGGASERITGMWTII